MDIANRLGITPPAVSRVLSSQPNGPFLLFDRTLDVDKVSIVTIDDFGGAVKASEYLAVRGYTRIATSRAMSMYYPSVNAFHDVSAALHVWIACRCNIFHFALNNDEASLFEYSLKYEK